MYVLIECDDEDTITIIEQFGTRAVGLYRKPTVFCECNFSRKPPHGWLIGPKYRWWICSRCHKPSKEWTDSMTGFLGTNLIKKNVVEDVRS